MLSMKGDCFLIVDAALAPVRVGLLRGDRLAAAADAGGEALDAVFEASAELLRAERLGHAGLAGYLYGAGPGTLLGLRLAAMAIEGWRSMRPTPAPVRQYLTLRAAAAALANTGGVSSFDLLVPVRRGLCARVGVRDGRISPPALEPVVHDPPESTVPRYHLPVPNNRLPPPPHAVSWRFALNDLPPGWFAGAEVSAVDHPVPFNPSPASFAPWAGERHRRA